MYRSTPVNQVLLFKSCYMPESEFYFESVYINFNHFLDYITLPLYENISCENVFSKWDTRKFQNSENPMDPSVSTYSW